jgi:hypothetical protein
MATARPPVFFSSSIGKRVALQSVTLFNNNFGTPTILREQLEQVKI